MYLQKIEIPSFRVLHDVVLEFGEIYAPQIFPLGSENGGGKSTVLQLLFALLHCSTEPKRLPYLQNLLATDSIPSTEAQRVIARLTLRIKDESHTLEFISLGDLFLQERLAEDSPPQGFRTQQFIFKRTSEEARKSAEETEADTTASQPSDSGESQHRPSPKRTAASSAKARRETGAAQWLRIERLLTDHHQKFITTYICSWEGVQNTRAIVCRIPAQDVEKTESLLRAASSRVFLLSPTSHQYLFLPRHIRRAALYTKDRFINSHINSGDSKLSPQLQYLQTVEEAQTVLTGFLSSDWPCIRSLFALFLDARDEDFKQAVQTGSYGTRYITLLQEVNALLFGKQVRPLLNSFAHVVGVEFIVTDESRLETPLSLEDLSQGELKRLMIYAWLRSSNIQDALVLIDEIETSFHPDWQSRIVKDLHEWGPSNQYILATHSYELCQALTPRHVRELTPGLRRAGQPPAAKDPGSHQGSPRSPGFRDSDVTADQKQTRPTLRRKMAPAPK